VIIESQILRDAIAKWGIDLQLHCVEEELAELIVALKHFRRSKATREQVIEEMADVYIMLGQLSMIMECDSELLKAKEFKLERLKKKIEEK
jgi:NTP pyrophosphatase (non-canonical NTP hydrolase)